MYIYDNYQNKLTHLLDQQRVFEMSRPSFVEPMVITPLRPARVVLPDLCTGTNCKCASPNGFGENGNRTCLVYGPAIRQRTIGERIDSLLTELEEINVRLRGGLTAGQKRDWEIILSRKEKELARLS